MSEHLILIAGMALVTYIPRVLPLMILSSRNLNPYLVRWLEKVPPAVLAALLVQEIFFRQGDEGRVLFISFDNIYLLACIPTVLVGWFTRSFFGTVAAGMASVAALRYIM